MYHQRQPTDIIEPPQFDAVAPHHQESLQDKDDDGSGITQDGTQPDDQADQDTTDDGDQPTYHFERILKGRRRQSRTEFLIKWVR